jgi:hypothetical protein
MHAKPHLLQWGEERLQPPHYLGEVGVWCRLKEWEEFKTRGNCWFCLDKGEEYFRLQFLRQFNLRFDSCTTPIQQPYNNLSHEGGPQYVGPTLM